MTSEELAEFISGYTIDYETCKIECPIYDFCKNISNGKDRDCIKTHIQWLEQEVEE